MKSEDKVCIINKCRIEDGLPLDLKISNVESSESKFLLNLIKFVLLKNY